MPGNMVVVGDAALARSILMDPRHEKAVDLLKSFEIALGGTCMFTQPNHLAKPIRKNTARAFGPSLVKGRMAAVCQRRIDEWIETVLEPTIATPGAAEAAETPPRHNQIFRLPTDHHR